MIFISRHVYFDRKISSSKPITINSVNSTLCPFCNYENLKSNQECLFEKDGSLLVKNLYPTIPNALQTVFIETPDCDASILNYDKDTLVKVFTNYFESFLLMKNNFNPSYITGFKNFGKYSSGSIHHQHMQLIGFYDFSSIGINDNAFDGISVYNKNNLDINLSTNPLNELIEINLSLPFENLFAFDDVFIDYCLQLQKSLVYVLNEICFTESFNLIFYFDGDIFVTKILPRLLGTSPNYTTLFLGFRIKFVPNNLNETASNFSAFLNKK